MNTEEMIQGMKDGDNRAFNEFDKGYKAGIYQQVHKFFNDIYHTNAVVAEVMEEVCKSISTFNGECEFDTWIFRIAENKALAYIKKKNLPMRKTYDPTLPGNEKMNLPEQRDNENPETLYINGVKKKDVEDAVAQLCYKQRMVYKYKCMERKSNIETGVIMGISEGAVKQHYFHALKALAILLVAYKEDFFKKL